MIQLYPNAFFNESVLKPVLVKGTDGGPDKNPRFEKNINMACKIFEVIKEVILLK